MQTLPVPPLTQTLGHYLETVQTLQTPGDDERTRELIRAFAEGPGLVSRGHLEAHAARTAGEGTSWFWQMWLDADRTTRGPLQLERNVGFQITWGVNLHGLERAADFIHRIAAVHLQHLRRETGESRGPRKEALSPTQWQVLRGGIRRPGTRVVTYENSSAGSDHRAIVVLLRGMHISSRSRPLVHRSASSPTSRPLTPPLPPRFSSITWPTLRTPPRMQR